MNFTTSAASKPAKVAAPNKGIKSYRTGWLTRLIRPGVYAEAMRAPYADKGVKK